MTDQSLQKIQIDIPPLLVRKAKAGAALAGVNLSTFCAQALAGAVQHLPDKSAAPAT